MALEEKLKAAPEKTAAPEEQEFQRMTDEEEQDLRIAVLTAEELIDGGGIDVIQKAVKESSDPGQVIGEFLMQLASNMEEKLPADVTLSPNIWLSHGGWVEQISDFLQEEYKIDRAVMDRAEMYIGSASMQMAQSAQAQQGAAPAGGPAVPQPAAPQPMGGV